MGLLDSEAGKRRLLSVEIPVIERYNEGRDPDYKIQLARLGGTLVLHIPLAEAESAVRVLVRPKEVRYYLVRSGEVYEVDHADACLDRGVYLLLAEVAARS